MLASEKESSSSLRRSTKSRAERFERLQIWQEGDMLSLFAIEDKKDAGKESSPMGDESPHDDIMEREETGSSG